ncbi:MAG: hypothetical protein H6744_07125 [Deltaproteobacteria bacterium]|nr:hypothetical protein [Deltaproteobacteria bacterium]MCB9786450.1 hypothetical protein [Deltaproteobacteria bacterium]
MRARLLTVLTAFAVLAPTARADAPEATRDPRNWPTLPRLIADRFADAGKVVTLRVHAKRTEYFNCAYRRTEGRYMAFTLLGGPLETLTGYVPRDLGKVLERQLAEDPWLPITVQVRFDPERLSELCPDQVEVLKWARGWQYPAGTLSPGRPDANLQPTPEALAAVLEGNVWRVLTGRKVRRHGGKEPDTSEAELLGKVVSFQAGARLSNAFSCAFRGAARTHYGVRLHDGEGHFIEAFVPRSAEARSLVDHIALHRDIMLAVQGRVVKQVPSNYCAPQLEITGWSFPAATGAPGR